MKAWGFNGPQLCQHKGDLKFEGSMSEVELEEWKTVTWFQRTFLTLSKRKTMRSLPKACWLLVRTLGVAQASKCTTYSRNWVSRQSHINECRWIKGEVPSWRQRDWCEVSKRLGYSHVRWLLLDPKKRYPCSSSFYEISRCKSWRSKMWAMAIYNAI